MVIGNVWCVRSLTSSCRFVGRFEVFKFNYEVLWLSRRKEKYVYTFGEHNMTRQDRFVYTSTSDTRSYKVNQNEMRYCERNGETSAHNDDADETNLFWSLCCRTCDEVRFYLSLWQLSRWQYAIIRRIFLITAETLRNIFGVFVWGLYLSALSLDICNFSRDPELGFHSSVSADVIMVIKVVGYKLNVSVTVPKKISIIVFISPFADRRGDDVGFRAFLLYFKCSIQCWPSADPFPKENNGMKGL